MRALCRSGPWLLVLGVVLAGCSNSGGPASKGPAGPANTDATQPSAGASDVTLVVEGMT